MPVGLDWLTRFHFAWPQWLGICRPPEAGSQAAATDAFQQAVVRSWRSTVASGGSVADAVINNLFPWCFTPETYAKRPEFIAGLADFVRSRPPQSVENFLAQSDAVLTHDATTRLADIGARTQITYGRWDLITSTRFLAELTAAIPHAQSHVFEDCSHVALHENPSAFNEVTLAFLTAQRL